MKPIKIRFGKLRRSNRNIETDERVKCVMNANQRQFHLAADGQSA